MARAKYVYDLHYQTRMDLCRILDQNDKWEELGGVYMDFDVMTIHTLRKEVLRGYSPTEALLERWGHQNHTVLELFVLLSHMQHYQAMLVLKDCVDPEYHRLIYEGEENLGRLPSKKRSTNTMPARNDSVSPDNGAAAMLTPIFQDDTDKTLGIDQHNLNNTQSSNELPHKVLFTHPRPSHSNRREEKILNVDVQHNNGSSHGSNAQTVLMNLDENHRNKSPIPRHEQGSPQHGNKTPEPVIRERRASNLTDVSSLVESMGESLPHIRFKELELATHGWDPQTILGKGGFGTVYKGTWKNTQVAIKRTRSTEADEDHRVQMQQILEELKILNKNRHDNILPLYGFSIGDDDPCLIYQYMSNGSLEDRLLCRQSTKPLTWSQRQSIATGSARGLQFLHTIGQKPLIHGDIKSANILLDSDFKPRIGDFGLAREGPYNHYTHMKVSRVHGTRPYLPDEFLRGKKLSTKVDTYSFGVVLFELATGLRAYEEQRSYKYLYDHVENCEENNLESLMDKKAGTDEQHIFMELLSLGRTCVSRKPKDRPEMELVLQSLEAAALARDKIIRAHSMVYQNNLQPSNPLEIQVFHDHLRNRQRMSNTVPPSSTAQPCTIPVAEYFHPSIPNEEVQIQVPIQNKHNNNPFLVPQISPENNNFNFFYNNKENIPDCHDRTSQRSPTSNNNNNNNNFLKCENLSRSPVTVPSTKSRDSTDNEAEPADALWMPQTLIREEIREPIQVNMPFIAVSPPSAHHRTGLTSSSSVESEKEIEEAQNLSNVMDSQENFSTLLPLISVLGVKGSDKKGEEGKAKEDTSNAAPSFNSGVESTAKSKRPWILGKSSN